MGENPQPAPETDEKKSRGLGSYLLWAFVAVMVYVLSSGPMIGTYAKGTLNENLWVLFEPLHWAYFNSPLHKPLGMYWGLWTDGMFDKNGD